MTIWIMPDFDREKWAVCAEAPTKKKFARAPMQNLRTPPFFLRREAPTGSRANRITH